METFEAVYLRAQEALSICYIETKGHLPQPSDLEDIQRECPDDIIQLVPLDTKHCITKSFKVVRKNLTIPQWLDDLAEKYDVNFSQVLRHALIEHLESCENISEFDRRLLCD